MKSHILIFLLSIGLFGLLSSCSESKTYSYISKSNESGDSDRRSIVIKGKNVSYILYVESSDRPTHLERLEGKIVYTSKPRKNEIHYFIKFNNLEISKSNDFLIDGLIYMKDKDIYVAQDHMEKRLTFKPDATTPQGRWVNK